MSPEERNDRTGRRGRPLSLLVGVALFVAGTVVGGATVSLAQHHGRHYLTDEQDLRIADARVAFASTALDGSQYGATLDGVDMLLRLCERDGTAIYRAGSERLTVRDVALDAADTLTGYQPDLVERLDRAARHCGGPR